jgi:hypothetical protein
MRVYKRVGGVCQLEHEFSFEPNTRNIITQTGVIGGVWILTMGSNIIYNNVEELERIYTEMRTVFEDTDAPMSKEEIVVSRTGIQGENVISLDEDELWWLLTSAFTWTESEPVGRLCKEQIAVNLATAGKSIYNRALDAIVEDAGFEANFGEDPVVEATLHRVMVSAMIHAQILASQLWKLCCIAKESGVQIEKQADVKELIGKVAKNSSMEVYNVVRKCNIKVCTLEKALLEKCAMHIEDGDTVIPCGNQQVAILGEISTPYQFTIQNACYIRQYYRFQSEALRLISLMHGGRVKVQLEEDTMKGVAILPQLCGGMIKLIRGINMKLNKEKSGDIINLFATISDIIVGVSDTMSDRIRSGAGKRDLMTAASAMYETNGYDLTGWVREKRVENDIVHRIMRMPKKGSESRTRVMRPEVMKWESVKVVSKAKMVDRTDVEISGIFNVMNLDGWKCREDWVSQLHERYSSVVGKQGTEVDWESLSGNGNPEEVVRRDWQWRSQNFKAGFAKTNASMALVCNESISEELRCRWWNRWVFKVIDCDIPALHATPPLVDRTKRMFQQASSILRFEMPRTIAIVELAHLIMMLSIIFPKTDTKSFKRWMWYAVYTYCNMHLAYEAQSPMLVSHSVHKLEASLSNSEQSEHIKKESIGRVSDDQSLLTLMQSILRRRDDERAGLVNALKHDELMQWCKAMLLSEMPITRKESIRKYNRELISSLDVVVAVCDDELKHLENYQDLVELLPREPEITSCFHTTSIYVRRNVVKTIACLYEMLEMLI